jgi:hypothetical protein
MYKNALRDLELNKTLLIVYNTFLKAQPEDSSIDMSRNI